MPGGKVQGLGFWVQGSGLRVAGSGLRGARCGVRGFSNAECGMRNEKASDLNRPRPRESEVRGVRIEIFSRTIDTNPIT